MLTEIGVILILILANGVFSMAEIALISSKKSRLEQMARKSPQARLALKLALDPNRFLSTGQVGITLIGILTGVYSGATLNKPVAEWLEQFSLFQPYAEPLAFSLVVLLITYFTLVLGELVPKRLGMHMPEQIAVKLVGPINLISIVAYPMVWLLTQSTQLILKALNIKESDEPNVTEEEIKSLVQQGTNTGEFEEVEQDIIERVFHLGDRKAVSLMTSHVDVEWLDFNDDFETNKNKILSSQYNVFPVCDGDLDNVLGFLRTKTFLVTLNHTDGPSFEIKSILEPPIVVPENMTAYRALELFREKKGKTAIVVDEFGSTQGMFTMTDIVEALLGDLDQPENSTIDEVIERADGSFLIDATYSWEDFLQHFDVEDSLDPEDRGTFHTLGGFILHLNEELPKEGDLFEWKQFTFEIVDMDNNRIDKIMMRNKPGHG